ncbi:MAG: ribbon-helix-helix protein, CopG family [Alphaproteobacteria bacterium]|nr:ribbon-helix-helix protein, CopG family [Alphaproteobacteria bacterium]OJV15982.1 MAG: anti-toxin [Alphaproteobacteria bacterium 33-17]
MTNLTVRLPDDLHQRLETLCMETDRQKSYYIKQALEEYLEEKEDYLIALGRLTKPGITISLEEAEKELGLD